MGVKNGIFRIAAVNFALSCCSWILVIGLMATLTNQLSHLFGPSAILLLRSLPAIVMAFIAGGLIDRSDKHLFLSFASIGLVILAATIASFPLLTVLIVATILISIIESVAFPSLHSMIPSVVTSPEDMLRANTIVVGTELSAMVVGPLIASLMLKHSSLELTFLAAAGFALIASLIIIFLTAKNRTTHSAIENAPTANKALSVQQSIAEFATATLQHSLSGFRHVIRDPSLIRATAITMLAYIGTGLLGAIELPFCTEVLKLKAEDYGFYISASGVGALIATLLSQHFLINNRRTFQFTLFSQALLFSIYGLQTSLWFALLFVLLLGANECFYRGAFRAILQSSVDPSKSGTVSAFYFLIERTAIVLGVSIGALTLKWAAPNSTILMFGICLALSLTLITVYQLAQGERKVRNA